MSPFAHLIRRLIKWTLLVIVFCLFFVLADSFGATLVLARIAGNAMDWRSHYLAGLGSVNCGAVRIRGNASEATQCALKANAEGRPFRVTYYIQGYDEDGSHLEIQGISGSEANQILSYVEFPHPMLGQQVKLSRTS